jgi:hypothetical protein
MLHVNPNLVFFGYLVVVTALCPICERVANRSARK